MPLWNIKCGNVIALESCAIAVLPIIQWMSADGDRPIFLL
jgi:hypothetical protein